MRRNVTLTIPDDRRFLPVALDVVRDMVALAGLPASAVPGIVDATRELLVNAIRHAYPDPHHGPIDLDILLLPHGIQIGVHDMGVPFDYEGYLRSERRGGLKRIVTQVDEFRFSHLGKEGKAFTIFKAHPIELEEAAALPYSDLSDESPATLKPDAITIRDFRPGDEEGISRLIYSNYTYSYYKSLFYYPKKIREMNEKGEIASVVAVTEKGRIVGHFALVRIEEANIAEIGVAVVHPDYKGQGIMNAMLDRIETRAKEMALDAIFGEALTMHPYSQRANLRHGFAESALLLGLVPNTVSLTDPNALRTEKRTAVLVGFKILNQARKRPVHLPTRYRKLTERIYASAGLEPVPPPPDSSKPETLVHWEISPYTQSGTLIIEEAAEGFGHAIRHHLHRLYRKHVDMIYADVNLHRCRRIDEVIALLKEEGFVFSGVLFYRKKGDDYLRMQLPNSDNVEIERIVCHSDFCRSLLDTVRDELDAF
jgi:N-acetylglutamate synthase-like GNAT family acetyltransferase/anti-sigma regulatory factor (Ser/Thr protein kinase)